MNEYLKNIVLIGMPGCGKSYIGKQLAEKLGYKFIDIDEYIVNKEERTIAEIFEEGEKTFRRIEADAVIEICEFTNTVIATGGGVVKNSENMDNLKKNSVVFFIDRSIENILSDIDISKRPLLKNNKSDLYKLYKERYELYKLYSDIIVENNDNIENVIGTIIQFSQKLN